MYAPMVLNLLQYQVNLARGFAAGLSMHHLAMPLEPLPLSTDLIMAVCNYFPPLDPLE